MKKSDIRQEKVLFHLIEEYIATQEPISSKLIRDKYIQDASPATIRIDLNKLEKANLIYQPHTSAGRIPTIQGYRKYVENLERSFKKTATDYDKTEFLRQILIKNYKDTPLALHYIMQVLARETDQLSFVAEPEVSFGYLDKLDVFKIGQDKLLFVVTLDSGLSKTVILKCDRNISEQQLKAIVRFLNDKFAGHRIYDIQNKYLDETFDKVSEENKLLLHILDELQRALSEISSFFIHFDGSISFLEQPEFDDKRSILTFLGFVQRQDYLINLMQKYDETKACNVLMGEELGQPELLNYALAFARYELFGVPGYLGVLGPVRMDYKKMIPIITEIANIITETTKKGMVVTKDGTK